MQEIIDYINFTFRLLLTSYGIVAILAILGPYAVYLFAIQRVHINVLTFVKLIGCSFIFTYGLLMLVVANLLEKNVVQCLGLFIMLIPIIISFNNLHRKEIALALRGNAICFYHRILFVIEKSRLFTNAGMFLIVKLISKTL